MSEVVDQFPLTTRGPDPKYRWDLWTDGRIHKLEHGVDFDTRPKCVIAAAYRWADTHGLRAKAMHRGGYVWLQFTPRRQLRSVG